MELCLSEALHVRVSLHIHEQCRKQDGHPQHISVRGTQHIPQVRSTNAGRRGVELSNDRFCQTSHRELCAVIWRGHSHFAESHAHSNANH